MSRYTIRGVGLLLALALVFGVLLGLLATAQANGHDREEARATVPSAARVSRSLLSTKESSADNIKETKKKMPRYGIDGKPAPSDFEPDDQRYWEGIAMYAVVGVAFAVLSVLFGLVFCCCRCCCGCCGGRKPTEGCCCPNKESVRVYTTCERWWIRIGMFVIVALVFAMAIMGYVGNADFTKNGDDFLDTVVAVIENTKTRVLNLKGTIESIQNNTEIDVFDMNVFDSLANAMQDVIDSAKTFKSDLRDWNELRELFLNIIFGWTMFIALFGLLGALCNCAWPACVLSVFGFFTLFIVWIMFAVHFPLSIVVADVCRSVETFIDDRRACDAMNAQRLEDGEETVDCTDPEYTPTGKHLNEIIKCQGKEDQEDLITSQWKTMTTMLFASGSGGNYSRTSRFDDPSVVSIRGLMRECNYTVEEFQWYGRWRPDGSFHLATATRYGIDTTTRGAQFKSLREERDSLVAEMNARNGTNQCTAIPDVDIADKFTKLVDGYLDLEDLSEEILDLTSCDYILSAFEQVNTVLCVDALQSMDLMAGSFTTMGFLFWFACFFAILGMKRFGKQTQVEDGAEGEYGVYEMEGVADAPPMGAGGGMPEGSMTGPAPGPYAADPYADPYAPAPVQQ